MCVFFFVALVFGRSIHARGTSTLDKTSEMSILDDDSFESYFNEDTSPGSESCNDVKGRYNSCFFKSYSESGSPFLCQDAAC